MTSFVDGAGGPMGCEQFEALLPDYLDGADALPVGQRATADAHRLACPACAALATDLEALRDEATALPLLAPERDLWAGIEARIATPVVALDEERPARRAAVERERAGSGLWGWHHRPWLQAAAAVLLVALTASVTYNLTARRVGPTGAQSGVPVVAVEPERPASSAPSPDAGAALVPVSPPTAEPASAAPAAPAARAATTTLASERPDGAAEALGANDVYDREIALMRRLLDERRAGLDTGTVRVLERNLDIIDRAIGESRAALLADPASPLLHQQLSDALGEKLELMRTAVLISRGAD